MVAPTDLPAPPPHREALVPDDDPTLPADGPVDEELVMPALEDVALDDGAEPGDADHHDPGGRP